MSLKKIIRPLRRCVKGLITSNKKMLAKEFEADKIIIPNDFKKNTNQDLDLNSPKTINEKIQWLKLYDRNPLKTICADKIAVRKYVEDKIGAEYLIPLIYKTTKVSTLVPNRFPSTPFIIKTNHDSGDVFVVKEKDKIDWPELQSKLKERLKINYYYKTREWQYKSIKPTIVVEELLLDADNNIPCDYKFFCFHNKAKYIQVDSERFEEHKRTIYNTSWEQLGLSYKFPTDDYSAPPKHLKKMIELAENLSEDFLFVRVDLYNFNDKIYFGELTFHPGNGFEYITPYSYDLEFGSYLKLPQEIT